MRVVCVCGVCVCGVWGGVWVWGVGGGGGGEFIGARKYTATATCYSFSESTRRRIKEDNGQQRHNTQHAIETV